MKQIVLFLLMFITTIIPLYSQKKSVAKNASRKNDVTYIIFNKAKNLKLNFNKSQFETTADYEERIGKIKIDTSSNKIPVRLNRNSNIGYDADDSTLYVVINTSSICDKDGKFDVYSTSISSLYINKEDKYYSGQNAFGAKKMINKLSANQYSIVVVNKSSFHFLESSGLEIDIKSNPIVARKYITKQEEEQIDRSLGCLFIGSLSYPYYSEGYYYSSPTIDDPYEIETNEKYVYVHLDKIQFYDKVTGKIIHTEFPSGEQLNKKILNELISMPLH